MSGNATAAASSADESLSWVLGLALGCMGTFLATLSKVLWRWAHVLEVDTPRRPKLWNERALASPVSSDREEAQRYERRRRRVRCTHYVGTAMLLPTMLCDISAFAFAPQPLVSGTAGLSCVFNLLLAPWLLGEQWSWWDVLGASMVTVGCGGMALTNGQSDGVVYSYEELIARFTTPVFFQFCLGAVIYFLLLVFFILIPVGGPERKVLTTLKQFSWGAVGGSISGCFVFISCVTHFVRLGEAPWHHWQAWVILISAALCGALGFMLLNEALRRYDALVITPAFQAAMVTMGALSGLVFYSEYEAMSNKELVGFGISLVGILCGVACSGLQSRHEPGPHNAPPDAYKPMGVA
jgi:uncharacterized membrane protein